MRLIDADALNLVHFRDEDGELAFYAQELMEAPTIDAVPVVRCKDCKHWDTDSDLPGCVNEFNGLVCSHPDDFCSFGERKDGEG